MPDKKSEVHYGAVLLKVLDEFISVGILDFPLAAMIYAYFCKVSDEKKKKMNKECDLCE